MKRNPLFNPQHERLKEIKVNYPQSEHRLIEREAARLDISMAELLRREADRLMSRLRDGGAS